MTTSFLCPDLLMLLREPSLVLSADGHIVCVNSPFEDLVGKPVVTGTALGEFVDAGKGDLTPHLRRWLRSKHPVPGVITLRTPTGPAVFAVEGGRLSPANNGDEGPAVLVRCRPRAAAVERFQLLSDQIEALSREVAARKRAELAAMNERERFRITLASIGDAVITTDCDRKVTFMNPVAEKLTGWRLDQAQARPLREVLRIVNQKTGEPAADPCERVLETGRAVGMASHTALIRGDGTSHIIEDSAAPIRDAEGEIQGVVIVFRDATERHEAEERLRQQEEWFRATLGSVGDAVIATDEQGHVVFMNGVAEQLTGWTLDQARGLDSLIVFNIVNEDSRERVESPVTRVIREGVIVGLANHTILIARDGRECPIDDSGAPIRDNEGKLIGTVLVFRDITETKKSQQALRESERRFRTMADAAPTLIWMTDAAGQWTYVNRQWIEFTGRTADDEAGAGWADRIHSEDRTRSLAAYHRALAEREPFELEFRMRRQDEEYRWMLVHGQPRPMPDGGFAGYIGSCIDITDRRNAEQQLRSLNQALEKRVEERTAQLRELAQQLTRAEQEERRRLAQTLHDHLQQILVAARMRTEMLIRQAESSDIDGRAREVQDLLQQALEASRSLTLELSPPVLYDGGLCAALPWLAWRMEEQHQLRVMVHLDSSAEPHDEQSRVTLFLAVRELLFNIVKHAGVNEASVLLTRGRRGWLKVVVEDHGQGFPVEPKEERHDGGGFGLFNLRERIEFLGGQVAIDTRHGDGTRVTIDIPQGDSDPPASPGVQVRRRRGFPPAEGASDPRPGIRVLLADDHRILREGIAGLLVEFTDIELVAEAANGEEAVALAREHQPDVVIMDITMPKLNGIEATRLITQEMPDVEVIGLSMHDSEDMARAMREAGARHLIIKDGPTQRLVQAIREATGLKPA